jgi:serine/threonine protein kinase
MPRCYQAFTFPPQAANVLLQNDPAQSRGVVAKIADFGLSVQMNLTETHVSGLYQGTLSHMAPEVLVNGMQSAAADVFAFGITLWELFTACQPYRNTPLTMLPHKVSR